MTCTQSWGVELWLSLFSNMSLPFNFPWHKEHRTWGMTGAVTAVVPSQVALLRYFSSSCCLACAPTAGAVAQRLLVMGRTDSLKHAA